MLLLLTESQSCLRPHWLHRWLCSIDCDQLPATNPQPMMSALLLQALL